MDGDSDNVGARLIAPPPHTERNNGARLIAPPNSTGRDQSRPYVQAIAALCSLLLMCISLLFITTHSYAASPPTAFKRPTATLTQVTTSTTTATATDTPTPTATATNTPSPTATATNTPTPSPTATHTPTPTATATRSITPTATTPASTPTAATTPTSAAATSTVGITSTPGTTPTLGIGQTATTTIGNPTTTTNGNGSGSGNSNNPPPPGSQSNWLSFSAVIPGLLIVLGAVSAILIGLVVLRNRLMPPTIPNANLPPSGAQPWRRVRSDSLNGVINNQSDLYTAATTPGAPVYTPAPPVAASMSNMFAQTGTPTFAQPGNGHNNGFPPSPQWGHSANTYGFSPSQQWNNTMPASHGFSPSQQWNTMPGTPGFPPPQQWNTTPGPYGFSPAQQNGFSQNNLPPLQSGGSPFQQGNAPGVPGVPVPPVAQTGTFTSHRQVEFSPTTTGNQPAIQPPPHGSNTPEQSKTTTRPLPTSIRLRAMQRSSETVPTVPAKPE